MTKACETTESCKTTQILTLASVGRTTTTVQAQASTGTYNLCEAAYVPSLASPMSLAGPTRDQEITMPELSPLTTISRVSHTKSHQESSVPGISSFSDKKASFSQFVEDLITNSDSCEESEDEDSEEEEPQPFYCNFNVMNKRVPKVVFLPAGVRGPGGATIPIVKKKQSHSRVFDKTHEEDEDEDLMTCLHYRYPMSYVSEMISHQTECPRKPFKFGHPSSTAKEAFLCFLQGAQLPRQQNGLSSSESPFE